MRRRNRTLALALYLAGVGAGAYLVGFAGAVAPAFAHHQADTPRELATIARLYPDLHTRELRRPHPSWSHLRRMAASRWRAQHPAAEAAHRRHARDARITAWARANRAVSNCESHGRLDAYNPAGPYLGKWQFDLSTWYANGGRTHPLEASELEQDRVAYATVAARGWSPWPVCGRYAVSVP